MNEFHLYRSNLKHEEYYHPYNTLEEFKLKCHDFYLLQGIWFLENGIFDKVIIYRLTNRIARDKIFNVNGREFIQRFVLDFDKCFEYSKPNITFFRGGFKEYNVITNKNPNFFGTKLYLGAGKRVYPTNGIYDKTLVESEKDILGKVNPFFKTANSKIFYNIECTKKYDLVWICNNTQFSQKGQKFFINEISKSKFLKTLNILHVGNKPEVGIKLCKEYNINNIEFLGSLSRPELNKCINLSKFGIVTSNRNDGCPRVITEIMCTGTPLIIRKETRLLNYYKNSGVIEFGDDEIEKKIKFAFDNYDKLKKEAIDNIENKLRIDNICKMNLLVWNSPEP